MTEAQMQQLSASGRPLPRRWLAIIATIWAGQAVSMLTSYAAGFAAVWYVTETTGSPWMLSLLTICAFLPQGILSPFGGVIADKFNRRIVMIIADFSVGFISLILGFAILLGQASVGLIMVMVIARSASMAFHGPAMMAAMPMLVPEKHLMRINTLDQLLMSVCSIGAPAFGIFLYTAFGFHAVMFLDFFGAVVAVGALMLVKLPTVHDATTDSQGVLKNLADGWRALSARKGLVPLIIGITIGMMAFGPISAMFPLMTADFFSGDGWMASLVEATFGIGMIVGSGILMAWGGGKHLARLISVAAVLVGITTTACGLLTPNMFTIFVVLSGIMAVFCSWFNAPMITIVQNNTSEEKMGRALGFVTALIGVASPIGVALGGLAAGGLIINEQVIFQGIGVVPLFLYAGIIMIVLGLVIYLFKSVRSLDTEPGLYAKKAEANLDATVVNTSSHAIPSELAFEQK